MGTESTRDFHMIVIGSGPGGQRAALQGAKAGKKVCIVESSQGVGGACLHVGTIPSKSLRESVYRYALSSHGTIGVQQDHFGTGKKPGKWTLPDMKRLLKRRDRVVTGESLVIFDQLKRNGIKIMGGQGKLVGPHEVEVKTSKGKKRITADFIVIATGARPVSPKHIVVDHKYVVDSNSVLALKQVPKSLIVLGAGIIGCEYASMFATAGTKVFLVDRRNEILASVDREIVNHLVERFHAQGMELILGGDAHKIQIGGTQKQVSVKLSNGKTLKAEVVLVAQGRAGNAHDLGLEEVGVEYSERGLITVDKHFRTKVPSIYAVGDIVGSPALASTGMEQGRIASCHAFQLSDTGAAFEMPKYFPAGIYTIPEISTVGKTEEELAATKASFVVGRARYRELARGQIVGDRWGLLKLLVDRKTLKLLGVHIVGDNAADLVHIGQAVMDFNGDVTYFIKTVFNYPTLAEAYKTAAFHAVNQIKGTTKTR